MNDTDRHQGQQASVFSHKTTRIGQSMMNDNSKMSQKLLHAHCRHVTKWIAGLSTVALLSLVACDTDDSPCVDRDYDGVCASRDCDDQNYSRYPGQTWQVDCDGDTYYNSAEWVGCMPPEDGGGVCKGSVPIERWRPYKNRRIDCNDEDPTMFPGQSWRVDCDADGFGDPVHGEIESCLVPSVDISPCTNVTPGQKVWTHLLNGNEEYDCDDSQPGRMEDGCMVDGLLSCGDNPDSLKECYQDEYGCRRWQPMGSSQIQPRMKKSVLSFESYEERRLRHEQAWSSFSEKIRQQDMEQRDPTMYYPEPLPPMPTIPVVDSPMLKSVSTRKQKSYFRKPFYDRCPEDDRTLLWAQMKVAADLAVKEIKRIGVPAGSVSVAVLDSGFDMENFGDAMASPSFSAIRALDHSGDPHKDDVGHGTMVAGTIGGKDGVGVAPNVNLTVYRMPADGVVNGVSAEDLWNSARRACEEGHEIISISFGSRFEEAGIGLAEKEEAELLAQLADKGCLIVRSAGNETYRQYKNGTRPEDVYVFDDNMLRIAATGPVGMYTSFTTTGELSAPGIDVYTWGKGEVCGGRKGTYAHGTSFAAPIAAGISAQVVGVLQYLHAEEWSQLSGPMRIKTINRILAASTFAGTINSLRAVLIAERWTVDMPQEIEALRNLLSTQPPQFCEESLSNTCLPGDNACVDTIRRNLTACDTDLDSYPNQACLVGIMAKSGHTENALHWLRAFEERYPEKNEYSQAIAKATWPEFRTKWSGSPDGTESLMTTDANQSQFLLRQLAKSPDDVFGEVLDFSLDSFGVGLRFQKRLRRGSEEDLAYLVETINQAAHRSEAEQIEAWFQTWLDGYLQAGHVENFFLLPVRLFSAFIEAPETPEALRTVFKQQEDTLAEFLNREASLYVMPIVFNDNYWFYLKDDRYYFEPDYIRGIAARQKERTESIKADQGLLGLSALFVIDLIASDSSDYATKLEVIELEARQRQWTKGIRSNLTQYALYKLAKGDYSNVPSLYPEVIRERFENIVRNAVRPGFNYKLFPNEHELHTYNLSIIREDFITAMLKRDLVEFSLQEGRWIRDAEVLLNSLLGVYSYYIEQYDFHFERQATYQVRNWTPAIMQTLSSNRFRQIEVDSPRVEYENLNTIEQTITETVKNYSKSIIRNGTGDAMGIFLDAHYWYPSLCSMFKKYDRAYSALHELIDHLQGINTKNAIYTFTSARYLLEECYFEGDDDVR